MARATGTRQRPQLAMRRTISQPHGYGSCSLWRVVCPKRCFRPRVSFHVLSPMRDRTLSEGGGSVRRVAVARAHTTASASHGPDRIIRNVVQYFSVDGRDDWRPVSVPLPGSRINAMTNQQQTRKCRAWAQRQGFLSGYSACYTLLGMRVEPHMYRAPGRFGMLATSRIHRSASFFRGLYAIHLPLEAAHPSLLSKYYSY